jgi:hypothetical protein
VSRQRLRKHRPHRQNDKRGDQQELIGDRVENRTELGFLVETAREQAVQPVSDTSQDEAGERKYKPLVKELTGSRR